MRNIYLAHLSTGLIAAMGLLFTASSAAAVDAWPMKCQGGGDMKIVTTWSTVGNIMRTELFFSRAAIGSRTQAPAPGTCAWPDRGVRASEPRKLLVSIGGTEGIEMRCSQGQCDAITSKTEIIQLQAYVQAGAAFSVLVSNDNAGSFRVFEILR